MNLPEKLPESQDMRNRVLYNTINRLIDYARSITPQFGGNCALIRGASGYTLKVPPSYPSGISLIPCVITASMDYEDWVGVTEWDFSSEATTGSQFNIAKPLTVRTPDSEVIDGYTITYDYNQEGQPADARLATYPDDTTTWQIVLPRYLQWTGSLPDGYDMNQFILYVVKAKTDVTDDDDNPVTYLEVHPPRFWTASVAMNYVLDAL